MSLNSSRYSLIIAVRLSAPYSYQSIKAITFCYISSYTNIVYCTKYVLDWYKVLYLHINRNNNIKIINLFTHCKIRSSLFQLLSKLSEKSLVRHRLLQDPTETWTQSPHITSAVYPTTFLIVHLRWVTQRHVVGRIVILRSNMLSPLTFFT